MKTQKISGNSFFWALAVLAVVWTLRPPTAPAADATDAVATVNSRSISRAVYDRKLKENAKITLSLPEA